MIQLVSLVGSLLILGAYAAHQAGRVDASGIGYSLANAAGSGILTVVAVVEEQWGFLLLEVAWCAVSAVAVARRLQAGGRT